MESKPLIFRLLTGKLLCARTYMDMARRRYFADMTIGYLNYPAAARTVHRDDCRHPFKHEGAGRRVLDVNRDSFAALAQEIEDGIFPFRSEAGYNDLTLRVNFNDEAFELAVVSYLGGLLARRYKRLEVPVAKCSSCW